VYNSFLETVLATAQFPAKVGSAILDSYEWRYPIQLVRNGALSVHSARLLAVEAHYPNLGHAMAIQIATRDYAGLDAVLSSDETHGDVMLAILKAWHLSPEDQRRLVHRDLSALFVETVLHETYINDPQARGHLIAISDFGAAPGRGPRDLINRGRHVEKTERTREAEKEWLEYSQFWGELPLEQSLNDLGCYVGGLLFLSGLLKKHLGDGSDNCSLRSWMLFLALSETQPDAELKTVLDTAKRLATAE
jgi:hypothetical protein